ncbi:MAG: hypothetical protein AAF938_20060, partial [Myxococcota bacterium]
PFLFGACVSVCVACGSAPRPPSLSELRTAIETPIASTDDAAERSRLVDAAAEGQILEGMRRHEVEAAIGRGDPCSRHARCAQLDFQNDDWFYAVGGSGGDSQGGAAPLLIVGFDRSGTVSRVWNLRVHE